MGLLPKDVEYESRNNSFTYICSSIHIVSDRTLHMLKGLELLLVGKPYFV